MFIYKGGRDILKNLHAESIKLSDGDEQASIMKSCRIRFNISSTCLVGKLMK